MCIVSWSLAVTSEQIAPALLCNVLTTASLWTSGWWVLILENVGVTEQLLLVYLVAILRVRYREGQYCCD